MPVIPFLPAIATIGAGLLTANAAKSGAKIQANAQQQGIDTQMNMYNQTRSDLAPYMTTGNSALSQLASLFGLGAGGPSSATAAQATQALTQYPGYQFGFDQGTEALDRSAASKGLVLSGGQRRDITQFGTQYAQQQAWQPYLAQLNQMAGAGQNAAGAAGGFGAQTANAIQQGYGNIGQANASGVFGQTNAFTGLLAQSPGLVNSAYKDLGGGNGGAIDGLYKLSDRRLKTDVEQVGLTHEGLPIYTYRLQGGPLEMGVMAQDVEIVRPDAVVTLPSGLKAVDYGKVSPLAERLRLAA